MPNNYTLGKKAYFPGHTSKKKETKIFKKRSQFFHDFIQNTVSSTLCVRQRQIQAYTQPKYIVIIKLVYDDDSKLRLTFVRSYEVTFKLDIFRTIYMERYLLHEAIFFSTCQRVRPCLLLVFHIKSGL